MNRIKTPRKTTRRTYITPDDLKVSGLHWLDNKFTFTFIEYRAPKADIEVVISLDFWWLEYLATHIHTVINHAATKVDEVRKAMRGEV